MSRSHVSIACMAGGLVSLAAAGVVLFGVGGGLAVLGAGLVLLAILLGWT